MPNFKDMMQGTKSGIMRTAGKMYDAKGKELIYDPKTKKYHADSKGYPLKNLKAGDQLGLVGLVGPEGRALQKAKQDKRFAKEGKG